MSSWKGGVSRKLCEDFEGGVPLLILEKQDYQVVLCANRSTTWEPPGSSKENFESATRVLNWTGQAGILEGCQQRPVVHPCSQVPERVFAVCWMSADVCTVPRAGYEPGGVRIGHQESATRRNPKEAKP